MKAHNYLYGLTRAESLSVTVNKMECNVYENSVGYFVPVSYNESIEVIIKAFQKLTKLR